MLQVRKNEISLRSSSGGIALLRNYEGTLLARFFKNPIKKTRQFSSAHLGH